MTEHDPHCPLCGLRVYALWGDTVPPPFGCSDGLDAAPWTCAHVLNSITMGVIAKDHMGRDFLPHHERIFKLIGKEKADEIIVHIRAHNGPPKAAKRIEQEYVQPAAN